MYIQYASFERKLFSHLEYHEKQFSVLDLIFPIKQMLTEYACLHSHTHLRYIIELYTLPSISTKLSQIQKSRFCKSPVVLKGE